MKHFKAFWPALLWLAGITILSTGAGVPMPKFNLLAPDKLAHAGAYALLTWLLLYGRKKSRNENPGSRPQLIIWAFAAGYGVLMEWVQGTFFPNRCFEYDDMLANATGALIAILIWRWRVK